MTKDISPTASFIVIGNEILSGRTVDKNINYLARQLNEIGIRFHEVRVIADDENKIVATVNELRQNYDYVFTSGGIGPTHDDITASSMAKAFGVAIEENEEALAMLGSYYAEGELNAPRRKMAQIPVGASLIPNPISAAPGFQFDNVYVLAGIPNIMQAMFENVRASLKTGRPVLSDEVRVEKPESKIAESLAEIQARFLQVEIGSYPFNENGVLGVNVVFRSIDKALLQQAKQMFLASEKAKS